MKTIRKLHMSIVLLSSALAAPAVAHHSYAVFDSGRTVIIEGSVQRWEFTNPHAFLFVTVTADDGERQTWGIEAPSPRVLLRLGINRGSMTAGDPVTVELNPLRDGRPGGFFRKVTLADGTFFCSMPPGTPQFEARQTSLCAGTQDGPEIISAPGDARLQGQSLPADDSASESESR